MMWPFFTFYGGKWRAAPRYPVPNFNTIIEPFAGAAGYSTRYPAKRIILIEKDSTIAALWRYLIVATPNTIRKLPLIDMTQSVNELDVCPEARSLIGFWLNKGSASPCRSPSAWMRSGVRPKSYWGEEIRERIASQVAQIDHWKVITGDYSMAPDREATWFIDPPYEKAGKHYKHSSKDIDFKGLSTWCRSRRGQTLVCENEGATWLPFRPYLITKSTPSVRGKAKSRESLWSNDAIYER